MAGVPLSARKTEEQYIQQLLSKIKEKTAYEGDCWRYTGSKNEKGYGKLSYYGKTIKLSRFICYVFYDMELSSHMETCHKPECKFRNCWNPDHLYVGTHADNMQDRVRDIVPIRPRSEFYKFCQRNGIKHANNE